MNDSQAEILDLESRFDEKFEEKEDGFEIDLEEKEFEVEVLTERVSALEVEIQAKETSHEEVVAALREEISSLVKSNMDFS